MDKNKPLKVKKDWKKIILFGVLIWVAYFLTYKLLLNMAWSGFMSISLFAAPFYTLIITIISFSKSKHKMLWICGIVGFSLAWTLIVGLQSSGLCPGCIDWITRNFTDYQGSGGEHWLIEETVISTFLGLVIGLFIGAIIDYILKIRKTKYETA